MSENDCLASERHVVVAPRLHFTSSGVVHDGSSSARKLHPSDATLILDCVCCDFCWFGGALQTWGAEPCSGCSNEILCCS
jgi:hypothetical protein